MQKNAQKAMIGIMYGHQSKDKFNTAKERMLRWDLRGRDITDPRVLAVMAEMPREEFIPQSHRLQAYKDGPLPIGNDQTISQPYIVALMTQELQVNPECEVLEIGTGSGYQTAILGKLAKKVYTIERFSELTDSAKAVLSKLDIRNVDFYIGDGSIGWPVSRLPHSGCFDRIMITAGVPEIPEPIVKQLADGGRIVAPVGGRTVQRLVTCEKKADKLKTRFICDVRFVRLIGEHGFEQ